MIRSMKPLSSCCPSLAAVFSVAFLLSPVPLHADTNPPFFTAAFTNTGSLSDSSTQVTYAPNLVFVPSLQTNGPAEVTNGTTLYVTFLSNSLGQTNMSDASNSTAFHLTGASVATPTNIPGIVNPPASPNSNNAYFANGGLVSNNMVWMGINLVPGTNTMPVTNYMQIMAINGNNNSTTNWAVTNLALLTIPPQSGPPYLQVRFYNTSTNPPDQVYILPASTSFGSGGFGNGFWWSNSNGSNSWTNWIASSNLWTVRLSDIGVSGTNAQGRPYYAINTTNFPNAAWYLSYGGGEVSSTNMARPAAGSTNATWFGYEWTPFELTLSGNPADKCDTTYINEFSIPMVVRALTNSYTNAQNGIFPSNSEAFYQIGGWTNWTSTSAVAATLSNLVQQLTNTFPNAVITNAGGVPVMVSGPSSAAIGTLIAPQFTNPPFLSDAQNSFPTFGAYFDAVKAVQPGRKAKIKDFIGASGVTNAIIGTNNGNNPVFFFYYDFDLEVTTNNTLRLTGSLAVSNQPGSTATYTTNATNLVLEVGADAGPNDNWASSAVYLAPTPANYVAVGVSNNLTNGSVGGLITNVQGYSPYASNGLAGANISIAGSNLLAAQQVAFSGPGGTLVPSPLIVATNDTNISAVVPLGAVTGPIVVTTTNGSGKSSADFAVIGYGGAAQDPSVPAGGPSAPVVTGFSPTNGAAATPVFTISGPWFDIANGTGTGPTNTTDTNSTPEYYNSSFGTAVMGRIMGDLAAGFALGFINSTNVNPYYETNSTNAAYGDSPSGSWWGGNGYPAADSNSASYSQVNTAPQLSQWGNLIHQSTAVTYNHPIYDRMQFFSGTNFLQIQPASATNNNPDVWVVEVEFFNGMSSVGSAPPPSVLSYSNWLTNWTGLSGTNTNTAADPDGDGFPNIVEYAFDGDPTVGSPAMLTAEGDGTNTKFHFAGLQGGGDSYVVQGTANLSTGPWTNATGVTVSNAPDQSGLLLPDYYERRQFTVPVGEESSNFYRVIFTEP